MIECLKKLGYKASYSKGKFDKDVMIVKKDEKIVGYFFVDEIKNESLEKIVKSIKEYEQRNKESFK